MSPDGHHPASGVRGCPPGPARAAATNLAMTRRSADAVTVLARSHDGREAYGLEVTRQISASTLVLSDPHRAENAVTRRPRLDF